MGNGEHLISSESGKEGTMKLVYDGNYYSFTRLWYVEIWEIHLNFGVKIYKKQVNGFVYLSVHPGGFTLHMTGYAPACTKSVEKGSFLDKRRRRRLLQKGYIFRC